MSESVLEERIKKSLALMKSKDEKGMRFCNFYFDYYIGYEKHDGNEAKFSYTEVFDRMFEENILEEIGCIWRLR